jgi:hypothetical protein
MGNGLLVSISKEVPTILDIGEEVIEILQGNNYKGCPTIQIKASKAVGITGAHLLQKAYFERDKLREEIKQLREQNEYLINQRIQERNNENEQT